MVVRLFVHKLTGTHVLAHGLRAVVPIVGTHGGASGSGRFEEEKVRPGGTSRTSDAAVPTHRLRFPIRARVDRVHRGDGGSEVLKRGTVVKQWWPMFFGEFASYQVKSMTRMIK